MTPAQELRNLSFTLAKFANDQGFEPSQPFYITGTFNLKDAGGGAVYSDEAHLWCKACAHHLLDRARGLMPTEKRKEHMVCAADPSGGEDSPSACRKCGVSLEHCLTAYGFREEIAYYEEDPPHKVTPNEAWCIAQILDSAYGDEQTQEALRLGRLAVANFKND